jgi:hypothetical protein
MKFADGLAQVGWDILVDEEFSNQVTGEFKAWRETVAL